ncbi:MAG: phage portal protein family protein [Kiritimatiellia bacterium]
MSGESCGGAHSDTFQQIARGDAAAVSEVFQRGIDLPVLRSAFPGRPALAYFQLAPNDAGQTPAAVAQEAAALAAAGFVVDPAQLAEKTGYRQAEVASAGAGAFSASYCERAPAVMLAVVRGLFVRLRADPSKPHKNLARASSGPRTTTEPTASTAPTQPTTLPPARI